MVVPGDGDDADPTASRRAFMVGGALIWGTPVVTSLVGDELGTGGSSQDDTQVLGNRTSGGAADGGALARTGQDLETVTAAAVAATAVGAAALVATRRRAARKPPE